MRCTNHSKWNERKQKSEKICEYLAANPTQKRNIRKTERKKERKERINTKWKNGPLLVG